VRFVPASSVSRHTLVICPFDRFRDYRLSLFAALGLRTIRRLVEIGPEGQEKPMINERLNWRKAFEKIGPETLRLRLEHRRAEFPVEYAREAEAWSTKRSRDVAGHTGGNRQQELRAQQPSVPSLRRAIIIPVMAHTPKAPSPRDMVAGPLFLHADFGCDALLRRALIIFDGRSLCPGY
jgi:hypothetical protein